MADADGVGERDDDVDTVPRSEGVCIMDPVALEVTETVPFMRDAEGETDPDVHTDSDERGLFDDETETLRDSLGVMLPELLSDGRRELEADNVARPLADDDALRDLTLGVALEVHADVTLRKGDGEDVPLDDRDDMAVALLHALIDDNAEEEDCCDGEGERDEDLDSDTLLEGDSVALDERDVHAEVELHADALGVTLGGELALTERVRLVEWDALEDDDI